MFVDVNENDAKAAVKVWAETIARDRGLATDPHASVFRDFSEMVQALRGDRVDAVALTTIEYERLRNDVHMSNVFVAQVGGNSSEQYVLLAHSDSGITGLGNLQGRSLMVVNSPRTCLTQIWIETLLSQKGFKTAPEFIGSITPVAKPSQAALPVFFRRSDACILTRSAYSTLCELNPQLGKKLRIIESSPELVPFIFAFRGNYASPVKNQLLDALRTLHEIPVGQQVLTVFQTERVLEKPESFLQDTLDLIERRRKSSGSIRPTAASAPIAAVK
jgi:phosphonate transport system substrate-binding protein